jgi:hypothetical protein
MYRHAKGVNDGARNQAMSEKNDSNPNKSSSAFLTFWTTLPGILTGAAALITAIVGLYLALGPRNTNQNAVISPTPRVTPKSDVRSGHCFEQEYAKVDSVEVGSGDQVLTTKDGVTRAKFTDNHVLVGALRFRFYRVGDYFEIEEVLDSSCKPVEGVRNLSRQLPVDENNKPKNWDTLQIPLAGREYSLRLGCDAGICSAVLTKL